MIRKHFKIILLLVSLSRADETKSKSLLPFNGNIMNAIPLQIVANIDQYYVKDKLVSDAKIDSLLRSIAKDMVDALYKKHESENKLTDAVIKLLNTTDNQHPTNAIEIRRILDYISKKSAVYIESYANDVASPDLKRLVVELTHVSSEIAIIAALKDITWAGIVAKKSAIDVLARRKRSIDNGNKNNLSEEQGTVSKPTDNLHTTNSSPTDSVIATENKTETRKIEEKPFDIYSILSKDDRIPIKRLEKVIDNETFDEKPFINKTVLDSGKRGDFDRITLHQSLLNVEQIEKDEPLIFDVIYDYGEIPDSDLESTSQGSDLKTTTDFLSNVFSDTKAGASIESTRKYVGKMKHLENKASRSVAYSSDVAFFTAATLIATRRTMTASLEVVMAVKMAADGVLDRKTLMTSLAKVAAQQAAKQARTANVKAQSSQKALKQVMKYTSQVVGAESFGTANRLSMETISLVAIAKSMAAVSLEVAMNALFDTNGLNE